MEENVASENVAVTCCHHNQPERPLIPILGRDPEAYELAVASLQEAVDALIHHEKEGAQARYIALKMYESLEEYDYLDGLPQKLRRKIDLAFRL